MQIVSKLSKTTGARVRTALLVSCLLALAAVPLTASADQETTPPASSPAPASTSSDAAPAAA